MGFFKPDSAEEYFEDAKHQGTKKSIEYYTQAILLKPNYAEAYLARGDVYLFWTKELEKALTDFTAAIRFSPDNAVAYCHRGHVYRRFERYGEAIKDYTEAIKITIDDDVISLSGLYSFLGGAHYDVKQYEEALRSYTKAINLYEKTLSVYEGRGNVYEKLGMYEDAIKDWERQIRIEQSALEGIPTPNTYDLQLKILEASAKLN